MSSDREDMKEVTELEGILVKKKAKYLGMNIVCDWNGLI